MLRGIPRAKNSTILLIHAKISMKEIRILFLYRLYLIQWLGFEINRQESISVCQPRSFLTARNMVAWKKCLRMNEQHI